MLFSLIREVQLHNLPEKKEHPIKRRTNQQCGKCASHYATSMFYKKEKKSSLSGKDTCFKSLIKEAERSGNVQW